MERKLNYNTSAKSRILDVILINGVNNVNNTVRELSGKRFRATLS